MIRSQGDAVGASSWDKVHVRWQSASRARKLDITTSARPHPLKAVLAGPACLHWCRTTVFWCLDKKSPKLADEGPASQMPAAEAHESAVASMLQARPIGVLWTRTVSAAALKVPWASVLVQPTRRAWAVSLCEP